MAQTREGAVKSAAGKLGISVEEYTRRRDAGERHCWKCKAWKLAAQFPPADGPRRVSGKCHECKRVKVRKVRQGPSPLKGRRMSDEACRNMSLARNPQQIQPTAKVGARNAINRAIRQERILPPASMLCLHCGKPAREYHHHRGYGPSAALDVQALCRPCHRATHPRRKESS